MDFFLKHAKPANADATIDMVMDDFKKVKANLSRKYLETSRASFFVPFRDHFNNCLTTEVTSVAAEKFIYGNKGWNATTRATVIRHLHVLFNFAIKRGYATLDPFASIQMPDQWDSVRRFVQEQGRQGQRPGHHDRGTDGSAHWRQTTALQSVSSGGGSTSGGKFATFGLFGSASRSLERFVANPWPKGESHGRLPRAIGGLLIRRESSTLCSLPRP